MNEKNNQVFFLFPLTAVTCPGLNQMPNQNLTPVQTKYSYRDTVIFKCDEGYRLSSADIITCQSDGLWSDNQTSCTGMFDWITKLNKCKLFFYNQSTYLKLVEDSI